MVTRALFLSCWAAAALLAWPAGDANAQGHGDGRDNLFQYDSNHPAYRDIQREEDLGREHIDGPVDYGTDFPTSGPHAQRPTRPGFYDEPVSKESLVHALEHGNIVIYYDEPGDAALKVIRGWTDKYTGAMDAVIAVYHEGLGERIVLTAWRHRLELPKMDARASFFVDAFRGRGPENRVR